MNLPPRVVGVLFALASTVSEAIGQFGFKRAADRSSGDPAAAPVGPFGSVLRNFRWVVFGFGGFVLDGLLWSATLKYLDLTIAHPLGSLVFVNVAVFSRFVLREKFSTRRWAGIGCILAGALLVASDFNRH